MQKELESEGNFIVPDALKTWFVIHFFVDMIAAIPLFIMPDSGYIGEIV